MRFSIRADAMMVWFFGAPGADAAFQHPCFVESGDVTVPRGTGVEWRSSVWSADDVRYTVTTTSVPPGGRSFDSGVLGRGDRFRFVPNVAGTWEYRDTVSGATARLTAK